MNLSSRFAAIAFYAFAFAFGLRAASLAGGGVAFGADMPIQPGSELTLQHAIEIALQLHPLRMESESDVGAARAGVGVARADLLPQVYGTAQYLRGTSNGIGNTMFFGQTIFPRITGVNHDLPTGDFSQSFSSENNYGAGVSLSQFLFDFGKVRGFIDERKADFDAAQARLKLTELNLIFNVAQQYYGLLAANQTVKVYDEAITQRREHLHQAQVMANADLRPMIDVSVTQADLSRAELHQIQARNGVADAKVALDNAMGLAGTAPPYTLTESLAYQPVTADYDQLLQLAYRMRPDLKALIDDARAAGAQITQARSDYFPSAYAAAGYVAMGTGTPAANNYFAGLVINWPLFNGFRTEDQVSQARYREQAVGHAIEDLRQNVIQEVHTSFLNWQASVAMIERAKQTLDASGEELRLADERYRAGLGSIVELDDAQRRFTEDSAAYVNSLYGYAVARAAVDRATAQSLQGL
jgi:outer membrane protein